MNGRNHCDRDWLILICGFYFQVQLPVEIMSRDLPMTEDILMETTENNDVMELEKSSSNILQMAFLLKVTCLSPRFYMFTVYRVYA